MAQVAARVAREVVPLWTETNIPSFPSVEASNPDMALLTPAKPLRRDELKVEILSPAATRGAVAIETPKFDLVGRIEDSRNYALLMLDNRPIEVAPTNGQFKVPVELRDGENTLTFVGVDYQHRIATRTVEFSFTGDLEKLAAAGKRYALVIGNQDYAGGFSTLTTPHGDANDVATLLAQRFGFTTDLKLADGKTRSLLLLDAKKRDIERALIDLRKRLTDKDALLIYYAGHGDLQGSDAYWVPVDGEAGDETTWLSAATLTSVIRSMEARSVLVVSDSCYSGGLSREPPDLSAFSEDRRRALLKAGGMRSRYFISSGGTEPVLDGGGGGHSIFARAFLSALTAMPEPIFSSGELYHMHILPEVSGKTKQQPERREIRDSGNEGGDFILAERGGVSAGGVTKRHPAEAGHPPRSGTAPRPISCQQLLRRSPHPSG